MFQCSWDCQKQKNKPKSTLFIRLSSPWWSSLISPQFWNWCGSFHCLSVHALVYVCYACHAWGFDPFLWIWFNVEYGYKIYSSSEGKTFCTAAWEHSSHQLEELRVQLSYSLHFCHDIKIPKKTCVCTQLLVLGGRDGREEEGEREREKEEWLFWSLPTRAISSVATEQG